jgi:hypothetical protein
MHEYGILFLHHNTSKVTQDHFERAQKMNPAAPIVALSGGHAVLPGGVRLLDLDCYDRRWQKATNNGNPTLAWGNPDLGICQWYSQNTLRCKRWCLMEWDTKCCMSWPEFWAPVWDKPAAAIRVFKQEDIDKWHWFRMQQTMHERIRPHATGVYLFGCMLLSDHALARVTQTLDECFFDGFSELRLGSLLSYTWNNPVAHPSPKGLIHHASEIVLGNDTDQPGIWHPVKNLPTHFFVDDKLVKTRVDGLKITVKRADGTIVPPGTLTERIV